MERTYSRVATPRKDEFAGGAHADHLVVDQVRSHTDKRQISAALTNNLVSGSEGNEVSEAFERNLIAVIHVPCDSVV
jgi:hypothetical protein